MLSIRWGSRRFSQAMLEHYIVSSIKQMKAYGLMPGHRVVLYAPNSLELVIVLLCFWRLGIVACPVHPKWPLLKAQEYARRINAKLFWQTQDIKMAVCFDNTKPPREDVSDWSINPDQDLAVVATSGSSGEPKAAVLTYGQMLANARAAKQCIELTANDGWLLSLPLCHVSGLSILMRCLEAGALLVVPHQDDLFKNIAQEAVTHVSLVQTQVFRLLQHEGGLEILAAKKAVLLGGSALSQQLIGQLIKGNVNVYISYGLTEMASQVATAKVNDSAHLSVIPLSHVDLKLDHEGQILVKGASLFKGYVIGQKLHLPLFDGYFATGDVGQWDHQGQLQIIGRKDNMFIVAGENVYPEEIEKVLMNVAGVKQVIVVGVDDPEYGKRPLAFVDMPVMDKVQLKEFCQEHLPAIKVPVDFRSWPKIEDGLKPSRQIFQALV